MLYTFPAKFHSFALLPLLISARDCFPPVRRKECISKEVREASGIGFAITTSYGTSAIRYHNGSIVNLAKVDASQEYISMMHRLVSQRPRRRIPIVDEFRDSYSYYSRLLNKLLGRPPTSDVGITSTLIPQLLTETEEQLRNPIRTIMVARPKFDALTNEDLNDAVQYAGLHHLLAGRYPLKLMETSAAFAANGNGICNDYTNEDSCEDDEERMLLHQVFAVTYTKDALYVVLAPLSDAFTLIEDRHLVDFIAGLDHLQSYPSVSDYWDHVHRQLTQLSRSAQGWARRPITEVLLLGESAKEPEFLRVLREALAEISRLPTYINPSLRAASASVAVDPSSMAEPLYAAARGAAEYAKRVLNGPRGCIEPNYCRESEQNTTTETNKLEGVIGVINLGSLSYCWYLSEGFEAM